MFVTSDKRRHTDGRQLIAEGEEIKYYLLRFCINSQIKFLFRCLLNVMLMEWKKSRTFFFFFLLRKWLKGSGKLCVITSHLSANFKYFCSCWDPVEISGFQFSPGDVSESESYLVNNSWSYFVIQVCSVHSFIIRFHFPPIRRSHLLSYYSW